MAGNKNSGRRQEKPFRDALRMEIAALQDDRKGLRKVARKLIEMAEDGEIAAIKELADRADGKAVQMVEGPGDNGEMLIRVSIGGDA
jgi:hypothetical protein